jgi:hypothetical protein
LIRYLSFSILFFLHLSLSAQIRVLGSPVQISGRLTGKLTAAGSGKALLGGCVMTKSLDNKLITYTFTNDKGEYSLSKIPLGKDFKVEVSLYGYKSDSSAVQRFKIPGTLLIVRDWVLSIDPTVLDEVKIKARKSPFVIRKDTIEFDATGFKLLPHAILEDLLERLPGILIDNDGNITVNGKKATRIQVDGKDFFGGNTTIAMKNIPVGIIQKVQVTPADNPARKINRMVQADPDEVSINLVLKSGQNKGFLGNVLAGYGSMERYALNGMLASFGGKFRTGLFASAGNGSLSENAGGGASGSGGNYSGMRKGGTLTATKGNLASAIASGSGSSMISGGFNNNRGLSGTVNTELGKKIKVDLNYSYGNQENILEKKTERLNFQNSGNISYLENESTDNRNINHYFSANIFFTPDSTTSWRFTPTLNSAPYLRNETTSASSRDLGGDLVNSSMIENRSDGVRQGFGHALFFGKRSRDAKNGFILNWNVNGSQKDEQFFNYSKNSFVDLNGKLIGTNVDQKGLTKEQMSANDLSMEFSRKLNGSFSGLLGYRLNQQSNRIKKDVFNDATAPGVYNLPDSLQSGNNRNNNVQQNLYFQLGFNRKKLSIALDAGMRWIRQRNELLIQDTVITVSQSQFAPRLTFNYLFANQGNLNLSYNIISNAPSANQLSPLVDMSNPLIISKGNPFLKTALGHHFNGGFSRAIAEREASFHFNGDANFIKNQIIQDVSYDGVGRQILSFRNAEGYRSLLLSGGIQKGYHIKELSLRPFVNFTLNNNKDVGYIDAERNETKQWQYGSTAGISVSYLGLLAFSSSANLSFNSTDYSLENREDLNYNVQDYSCSFKVSPTDRIEFGSQFSYRYNSRIPEGFQRSAAVLNASLSYRFLKKEQLNFKFYVNDIFNNAIVNAVTVAPSFREDVSVNALKRYFLFSVQYNFNQLVGKDSPKPR